MPLELLASGCSVVINEGENNLWIDSDKKLMIYTQPDVENIVSTILNELDNNSNIDWKYIDNYLINSSWEIESKKILNYIKLL